MQTPPCYSEGGTKEAKHPRNSLKQTTMVYLNIWGVVLTLHNASIVVRKCKEPDILNSCTKICLGKLTHNDKRTWSCPDGPSKNVKKEHVILTWNSVKYVNVLKKCDDVTNPCLPPMWDFTNNINNETGDVAFNQKKRGSLSFQQNVWDLIHYIHILKIAFNQTISNNDNAHLEQHTAISGR